MTSLFRQWLGLLGTRIGYVKQSSLVGFLFNVSSLVQAIGRLRPTQRGAESKVQVFRYPFRSVDRLDASEKSTALFNEVCEVGCLNDVNKDLFMKIYAPIGLQEILSLREGCYLQALSMYFGFARLRCDRCGLCLKFERPDASKLASDNHRSITIQIFNSMNI
jgi:hypothetical protein